MADFKEIIKKLRQDAQLTQDQLAAALGLSRSAVSMYERGEREPDFETLEVIADHFNVDMNYLTGWGDDPVNYDDPDLVASIPLSYMEACGGDVGKAYQMMRAVDAENMNSRDQRDIANDLEAIMAALERGGDLMFDGDPMSAEAKASIMSAVQLGLEAAKAKNKERFTPKKYRKG